MTCALLLLALSVGAPQQEPRDPPFESLLEKLRSDDIQDREEASRELERMAGSEDTAVPLVGFLDKLAQGQENPELVLRANRILKRIPAIFKYHHYRGRIREGSPEHRLWLAHHCLSLRLNKKAVEEFKKAVDLDQSSLHPSSGKKKAIARKLVQGTRMLVSAGATTEAGETFELLENGYRKQVGQEEMTQLEKDVIALKELSHAVFPGKVRGTVVQGGGGEGLTMAFIESTKTRKIYAVREGEIIRDDNGDPAKEFLHWRVVRINGRGLSLTYKGLPYGRRHR